MIRSSSSGDDSGLIKRGRVDAHQAAMIRSSSSGDASALVEQPSRGPRQAAPARVCVCACMRVACVCKK
eukprot:4640023-Alexandrium_andersonii.AAC.1